MTLEILTRTQALAMQAVTPGSGDTRTLEMTQAAIDARFPAFWSLHTYHHQAYGCAARIANENGLAHAVDYLLNVCHERSMAGSPFVKAFLIGLRPANEEGQQVLATVSAQFSKQEV